MIFAGERYYYIYRIMLTTIGLWPYQKSSVLHTASILSALFSLVIFQLTQLLTINFDHVFVITILSTILPIATYIWFYICFYINIKKIKYLLERIEIDWNTADYSEMRILKKYASECRIFSLVLTVLNGLGFITAMFIEMLPIILDIVAPMNESRPRKTQINIEIFLDKQRYFFVYIIYENAMLMIIYLTGLPIFLLFVMFLRHSCALYKIASTLIGRIVTKHTLEIPDDRKTREMYRRIIRAIYMHKKAIQFTKSILHILDKWVLIAMMFPVLSLTCNLLLLIIEITVLKEFTQIIIRAGVVLAHIAGIFLSNFVAQTVADHSIEMFTAPYSIAWYLAPLPIQKLLLFVIQYSLKANMLTIGGIYVASLEGFSTLTTMSISYFTVLYNVN